MHDLGIYANAVDFAVAIPKTFDLRRGNVNRFNVIRQPIVKDFGDIRILANKNEHRWARIFTSLLPLMPLLLPLPAENGDRMVRVLEHSFGFDLSFSSTLLGGC